MLPGHSHLRCREKELRGASALSGYNADADTTGHGLE
jgi:hypothetical protein